jgi:hypothetical protein
MDFYFYFVVGNVQEVDEEMQAIRSMCPNLEKEYVTVVSNKQQVQQQNQKKLKTKK